MQNWIRTSTLCETVSVQVPPAKQYLYKHLWWQQNRKNPYQIKRKSVQANLDKLYPYSTKWKTKWWSEQRNDWRTKFLGDIYLFCFPPCWRCLYLFLSNMMMMNACLMTSNLTMITTITMNLTINVNDNIEIKKGER